MTTEVRQTGKIKFFDTRKGFGFIKPDHDTLDGKDVFLSLNELAPEQRRSGLLPDTRCSFVPRKGKKGVFAEEFQLI